MLNARGRIQLPVSSAAFLEDLILALRLTILPINPGIAELAQGKLFLHGDPADRLIEATALHHRAPLISADTQLRRVPGLTIIWE